MDPFRAFWTQFVAIFGVLLIGLAVCGLVSSTLAIILRRGCISSTTLGPAWCWTIATFAVWTIALIVSVLSQSFEATTQEAVWYFATVISVCPGIAVLGARRPVAGVWTVFVVLPLVFVLSMPLISAWQIKAGRFDTILLETPTFLGFCLVVLMGFGNYVGTRFSLPALLAGTATMLLATSFLSNIADDAQAKIGDGDYLPAVFLLTASALLAIGVSRKSRNIEVSGGSPEPVEAVWREFVATFGIVWAKRVGERINRAAEEERLPARIEISGVAWLADDVSEEAKSRSLSRLEHTLRRLLKRFVDVDWIEDRIGGRS